MAMIEGVEHYTKGKADVTVFFPKGKVCCANCMIFCRYEDAFRRYSCRATGEQLLLPFSEIGMKCPIKWRE